MRKRVLTMAVIAGLASAGAAFADDDCQVPMDRWQPRAAVQQMAQTRGWQVDRIKIDDGCYEVRGVNAEGVRFKAKLDPETLEIVKWKRKGSDDDRRDRQRDRQRDPQQDLQQQGAGPGVPVPSTPPAGGIFGNGAPPAATVR